MNKVVVTGGSGRMGHQVLVDLSEHGYEVINADRNAPAERVGRYIAVDFNRLGEVFGALRGADAVIHLAAIPSPNGHPNEVVFGNNVRSAYNILEAASTLGIRNVVLASSFSAYGMAFADNPPDPLYLPLDEQHPLLPQDAYALSKTVVETMADSFHRATGMQAVSMRLTSVFTPNRYRGIDVLPEPLKKRILWGYVDYRDAAAACRLAIETEGLGAAAFNIADDVTCSVEPSVELIKRHYPNVSDIREPIAGCGTLVSNKLAKARLNWQPVHRWTQYMT